MRIYPSILSADFSCLTEDIDPLIERGIQYLHLDVMDGHFVPNISFGIPVIRCLRRRYPDALLDAHLMIENPEKYLEVFLGMGLDFLSVHAEVQPDLEHIRKKTRNEETALGLAFNPDTDPEPFIQHLPPMDYVLAMTVQPGFGGQSFREDVLPKIRQLRDVFEGPIQVDGGINKETIRRAAASGANWFVAGSAVFGESDPAAATDDLLQRARSTLE